MRFSAIPTYKYLVVILCLLALSACGGGSGGGSRPEVTGPLPLPLPPGHGLTAGEITVPPGQSMEHGNVVVSCPAGGQACVLNAAADGSASYERTGGMPTLRILPLMAGPGLGMSDASPVFAKDETSTLRATLANPANVIPVLAATLYRHRAAGQEGVEFATDLFVKSIRRKASGAYVIDYVLDGADEQVTIPLDNCREGCRTPVNGQTFAIYNETDNDADPATMEDGLGEFEYLASHRGFFRPDDTQRRMWFVFGVRTEDLPMGTATYHSRFSARTWETANDDIAQRQTIQANMRIVANFDMRALEGRIYRVRITPRGTFDDRVTWPTSSFTLTNGRIVNGQFTATLTGVDSDSTRPFDESVRDFIGHILGEFYGPNAEEVGGVVTATRDVAGTADDRVLNGFIGGRKTDRLTGVNDSEALLMGFDRDFEGDSTTLVGVDSLTVESTADGYRITWSDDADGTVTVELSESDFGTPNRSTSYVKESNGSEFRLRSPTGAFTSRRSFAGFRLEHVDVMSWVLDDRDASGDLTSGNFGRIVYGDRTTDMPTTGTASYDGGGFVMEWPTDPAAFSDDPIVNYYRTNLDLSADFGNSAVTGNLTLREARPGDGAYAPASGGLSFNATISGNGLSATDLSGSGALAGYSGGRVDGGFYGPGATEVGGVFDATHGTQNKVITGYFAGQEQ